MGLSTAFTGFLPCRPSGHCIWGGDAPQLRTVGYLTTAAVSLATGYAINWLLGTAEMPHSRLQFDIGAPEFGFVADTTVPRRTCAYVLHRGYDDIGDGSVTMPGHFAPAVDLR